MAYPNLSSENDPGAFTVELAEKKQPINQGPQVGFEGMDDKESSVPHNNEQRQLLSSDPDVSRRPRLNTGQRVSCMCEHNSVMCCVINTSL